MYSKNAKDFYAVSYLRINGYEKNLYMHRHILGITDKKQFGDHIDHNGLNNQRNNLRLSGHGKNRKNANSHSGASSKYVGVCWHKKDKKWQAAIAANGKQIHLGQFDNEVDAAIARNKAAKIYYGEYAHLNFK